MPVISYPLPMSIYAPLDQLADYLNSKNIPLNYEDSFEGEETGMSLHYFFIERDSMNYRFDVFVQKSEIIGIKCRVLSNYLSKETFLKKADDNVMKPFQKNTSKLNTVSVKTTVDTSSNLTYTFEVFVLEYISSLSKY